jgi:hypothetical protein
MDSVKRTPPRLINVIAILQMVFGALGLLMAVPGAIALATGVQPGAFNPGQAGGPQAQMQKELQDGIFKAEQESMPGGKATRYGQLGFGVLLSLMMIASGWGLKQMQPWGRTLAILYAVGSLLEKVFAVTVLSLYTIPAMIAFLDQFATGGPQQAMIANFTRIASYASLVGPVVVAVYPIIVLVIMLKASTRAAFRGETDAAPKQDDYEDQRWGR